MFRKIKKIFISLYEIWGAFEHRKGGAILLIFMLITTSFLEALSIGFLLPMMEVFIEGGVDNDFSRHLLSMTNNFSQEKTLAIILFVFFTFLFQILIM